MDTVKIVSAVQAVWGKTEGSVETIPWISAFVLIPAAAIVGAVYVAERYFKLAKTEGVKGMVRFGLKVGSVQIAAWWAGRVLMVLVRPVERTAANLFQLVFLGMLSIVLWAFESTPWGLKVLGVPRKRRRLL